MPWWRGGVVYQIYPRSFLDTNGDGVGDLDGVIARLDHLAWLGVDAIWLSPIYPSPWVDGGYDVADYCDVDPILGDLATMDRLLAAAHERGLKVLLDWVPNHTSDQHPWFQSSRRDPAGPHGDWYWWAAAPANNWPSAFGGSAWSFDDVRGEYYLHLFTPAQPDLNWNHPDVRTAMLDGLRFWLDRGVDGFRADVINLIGRDPALRDVPLSSPENQSELVGNYRDPRTHGLLQDIRRVLDKYPTGPVMVGEIPLTAIADVVPYLGTAQTPQLHLAFGFSLMEAPWDAGAWRCRIAAAERAHGPAGSWPTWVLSSHDQPRHRTRYNGREDRARVAAVVLLTLRGTPFLYAGEELGLEDAHVPPSRRRDRIGRDGSRAPIPWQPTPRHGWAGDPWLPWPPHTATRNALTLRGEPNGILLFYRHLITLRRSIPALLNGELSLLDAPDGVLAYQRQADGQVATVLANFGDQPVLVPHWGRVVLHSSPGRPDNGVLPGCAAIVTVVGESPWQTTGSAISESPVHDEVAAAGEVEGGLAW